MNSYNHAFTRCATPYTRYEWNTDIGQYWYFEGKTRFLRLGLKSGGTLTIANGLSGLAEAVEIAERDYERRTTNFD